MLGFVEWLFVGAVGVVGVGVGYIGTTIASCHAGPVGAISAIGAGVVGVTVFTVAVTVCHCHCLVTVWSLFGHCLVTVGHCLSLFSQFFPIWPLFRLLFG